jgi:hypothetical protein
MAPRLHRAQPGRVTQQTPTPAPAPGELTAADLTLVVGGTDRPGTAGDNGPYEPAAGRQVSITVPT